MADSRPNRTPEVVVFSEPTRDFNEQKSGGRRKFVQKRSNILRGGGDGGEFFSLNPEQEDSKETDLGEADLFVRLDMRTALKEVKSLCGEGLVGKEKRRYEEQRAKELGGKVRWKEMCSRVVNAMRPPLVDVRTWGVEPFYKGTAWRLRTCPPYSVYVFWNSRRRQPLHKCQNN
jgi:hypothetical protein